MKSLKTDLQLIGLTIITSTIWLFSSAPYIYGLSIYFLVFIFLFINKRPVSHYLVVTLFSVMSDPGISGKYSTEFLLLTLLLTLVVVKVIQKKELIIGKFLIVLSIYALYTTLSLMWTPIFRDGHQGVYALMQGIMVYFILINSGILLTNETRSIVSKVATYLMLVLTLQVGWIYYQNGLEAVLQSKGYLQLGWGFSNTIAVIYTFLIPVALYKYVAEEKYYPQYFILDLLGIIGLILTLSRGAIVGIAAVLAIYTVFTFRKRIILRYYSLVALIILIVYKVPKLYDYYTRIKERFVTHDFLDDSNRFPLYKLAYEKFLERPLFGHGVKSSKYLIRTFLERENVYFHNFILQIAATLGIVGVILTLVILFKFLILSFKPQDLFITSLGLGVVASLLHQMVDISYDRFFFGLYMYSIIGVIELYRHYKQDDPMTMTTISLKRQKEKKPEKK